MDISYGVFYEFEDGITDPVNMLKLRVKLKQAGYKPTWSWQNIYTSISKSANERNTKYRGVYAAGGHRVPVNGSYDYKGCIWCGNLKFGSKN